MYNVLKQYNICPDYAHCMRLLYDDLRQFVKKRFMNGPIEFQPDERIVFDITDLDYFVDADFPGFALYNLQLILRDLDIPNFACAVLSNMPNYDHYTKKIRDILRPDDVPLRAVTISTELDYAADLPQTILPNWATIRSPFIVMSRLSRFHRTVFMSKLFEKKLHTMGMVSYHNIPDNQDYPESDVDIVPTKSDRTYPVFLTTLPLVRVNNETIVKTAENAALVNIFKTQISHYANFADDTDIANKEKSMEYHNDSIQKALVYIALESTVKYPTAFQSGITFKSIAQKRPFVIFGSPGSIQLLKNQGFLTFSEWWDESYDNEPDIEKRLDKIIDIVRYLTTLRIDQLQEIAQQMQPVLDHNYHHFTGAFIANQLLEKDKILAQPFIDYD